MYIRSLSCCSILIGGKPFLLSSSHSEINQYIIYKIKVYKIRHFILIKHSITFVITDKIKGSCQISKCVNFLELSALV